MLTTTTDNEDESHLQTTSSHQVYEQQKRASILSIN